MSKQLSQFFRRDCAYTSLLGSVSRIYLSTIRAGRGLVTVIVPQPGREVSIRRNVYLLPPYTENRHGRCRSHWLRRNENQPVL